MSEEDDDDDVATVTLTSAHHAVAGPVRQRLQEESSASGQRPPPPVTQGRLTVPFTNSDITLSFINYQCKTHYTRHSLISRSYLSIKSTYWSFVEIFSILLILPTIVQ